MCDFDDTPNAGDEIDPDSWEDERFVIPSGENEDFEKENHLDE